MDKHKTIQIEITDKVAVLKLNRPEQLNAMNRQMMEEIIEAIRWINEKKEITVAVIYGKGRAFMAGADIKEYGNQTIEEFNSFQEKGKQLYESIENRDAIRCEFNAVFKTKRTDEWLDVAC